jgi:hypothetical protein
VSYHYTEDEYDALQRTASGFEAERDEFVISLRSIEATLGTLDHSAAINDEKQLGAHLSWKIARLLNERDALRAACLTVKDYLNRLEGLPEDDPLLAMRRHFHAPLHKAIDSALEQPAAQSSERGEQAE